MDPEDPDPLRTALSHQGIKFRQHENMLQGVMKSLQDLTSQVSNLLV